MGTDGARATDAGRVAGAVERVVDLPAGVDAVWRALTDPSEVAAWFGTTVQWELRPGGAARFGPGDDGGGPRSGTVEEVERARRLTYRWWPDGSGDGRAGDGASVVRYELVPVPGGTRLTVTEAPTATCRTTLRALATAWSPWDSRLVGLWAGIHERRPVRA